MEAIPPTAPRPQPAELRLPDDAVRDGPHLRLPAGGDRPRIVVERIDPGFGRLEDFVAAVAGALVPDGELALRAAHAAGPRALRAVLEGRVDDLDEVAVDARRLLDAARGAGLVPRALRGLPGADRPPRELAARLRSLGYVAPLWLGPPPPDHLELRATRGPARACSAIVGPGEAASRDATLLALRGALPPGAEIVPVAGARLADLDGALESSLGDVLWFVPAGATPDRSAAERAVTARPGAPVATCAARDELAGLAVDRTDALLAGPFAAAAAAGLGDGSAALADWSLRLARVAPRIARDAASPDWPAWCTAADAPDALARLQERWSETAPAPRAPAIALGEDPLRSGSAADRAPRLSLCAIVRDERELLPECLRRARGVCDELVVVDTGSVDGTPELAAAAGARVLHVPWADDFAAARNAALDAARGDWVLVLDADERLSADAGPRLREAISRPDALAFDLRVRCRVGDGERYGPEVWVTRLFRRLPGVRYAGRIHEQVAPSLRRLATAYPDLRVLQIDVDIDHLGYVDAIHTGRGKAARNHRLFELQIAEQPDDPYTLFKFAEHLLREPSDARRADRLLQRALERFATMTPGELRTLPFAAQVFALVAQRTASRGTAEAALAVAERGLRTTVPTPDLLHVAGALAIEVGQPRRALRHLRRCVAFAGVTLQVTVASGVAGPETWLLIADAERRVGEPARSRAALERARAEAAPDTEVAALATASLALLDGRAGDALAHLTGRLATHPDSPRAVALTAGLLRGLGHHDRAARLLAHRAKLPTAARR
ncbi:MAG: glycosyltransferase family 2 protein [Planctomycetes bacterium]|nr:glycosyltransferase family 2 protein [Planctomycetota bacterium]